jgi:hypothetical protein
MNKPLMVVMLSVLLGVLMSVLWGASHAGAPVAQSPLGELMEAAQGVVTHAVKIEVAKLKPAPANTLQANARHSLLELRGNTIAGFPIDGDVKPIARRQAAAIAEVILNPKHYADILLRCANAGLIGIRFSTGREVAEFAYGQPCGQGFWAMKIKGVVHYEGAVLGDEYGKSFLRQIGEIPQIPDRSP